MPPSAISVMPLSFKPSTPSSTALNCGTPTPALTRGRAGSACANAKLDGVRASFDEILNAFFGSNGSNDERHVWE